MNVTFKYVGTNGESQILGRYKLTTVPGKKEAVTIGRTKYRVANREWDFSTDGIVFCLVTLHLC